MAIHRSDKYTETNKQRDFYSDFFADLTVHPNTEDLVRYTNEDSVKRSIHNLLLTNKYERMFNPDLGSNINKILFEQISVSSASMLKTYCEETINNFEKRAKLIDIQVDSDEINQSYRVTIYFYVVNKPDPVGLAINLYRVR